jgi:hypothetical protein
MKERPYITDRTRLWRTRDIKPSFVEAIDKIEESGCQILSVASDTLANSWAYTTGIYDTCGKPELITIGLPSGVAGSALNEAARRLRRGIVLTAGRHDDIIGNVDVVFRSVDPKWLHHIMLRTSWFYGGEEVPVLQLIFPDLQNRFPGEPGFDTRFAQPLLAGEIKFGSPEYEFWVAHSGPDSLPPLLN